MYIAFPTLCKPQTPRVKTRQMDTLGDFLPTRTLRESESTVPALGCTRSFCRVRLLSSQASPVCFPAVHGCDIL